MLLTFPVAFWSWGICSPSKQFSVRVQWKRSSRSSAAESNRDWNFRPITAQTLPKPLPRLQAEQVPDASGEPTLKGTEWDCGACLGWCHRWLERRRFHGHTGLQGCEAQCLHCRLASSLPATTHHGSSPPNTRCPSQAGNQAHAPTAPQVPALSGLGYPLRWVRVGTERCAGVALLLQSSALRWI